MALKLPKFNFAEADSKTRIGILLGSLAVVVVLVFVAIRVFGGGATTTGPSKVAGAPGLQSVPGGQVSPEYYRALVQANAQAAQQAKISGGSAVPTLLNMGGQQGNCTVLCPGDDDVDVSTDISALQQQGKLSQEDANRLLNLAKNNASVEEYAAALDELVKQGKLTPEQARLLLEKYKKQHQNALLKASAANMDPLIKSGQLPLAVANELLALQKKNLTPEEYAAELDRLVREGKITPEMAARLLAQYTQQRAQELKKQGQFNIQKMAKAGELTQEVANQLMALQDKNPSTDDYNAELQKLVAAGKLTPAAAAKLLDDYKKQRASACSSETLKQLASKGGEKAAEAQKLLAMQSNNVSIDAYVGELKQAVQANTLSPDVAAKLLQAYRACVSPSIAAVPGVQAEIPGAEDFAKLQQRLAVESTETGPSTAESEQFKAAQAQAAAEAEAARKQRIQDLATAMSGQAQTVLATWQQPKTMQHMAGTPDKKEKTGAEGGLLSGSDKSGLGALGASGKAAGGKPLIKAGTILFAVLDTAVDSDYPDTPVMATIVDGDLKGAKLLGKLSLAQGKDRVSLNFNMMNKDEWNTSKSVNAFAIDPDTARTVLATNVDHHYMMRYGSIFASSFLTGYSNAIMNSGSTKTTGIFGTTTQTNTFSPGNKIAVGLGQAGTAFTGIMSNYVNTPATVKVKSGVGLGILFMSDVPAA